MRVDEADVLPIAREVLRRRLRQGGMVPKLQTVAAQVALRYAYQNELKVDDLTAWLQVRPVSDDGEILNVIPGSDPFRVYAVGKGLVHVFATYVNEVIEFKGWLSDALVQECPFTKPDDDADGYYEVDALLLAPMPETMSFNETCRHLAGIWDDTIDAWECPGCARYIPNAWDRGVATGAIELAPAASTST